MLDFDFRSYEYQQEGQYRLRLETSIRWSRRDAGNYHKGCLELSTACDSFESVRKTLSCAKDELGEILAAFEFMDEEVLDQVATELPVPLKREDGGNYHFCILVETQGSNSDHDALKLETFLEKVMEDGNVIDGIVAQDLTQVRTVLL